MNRIARIAAIIAQGGVFDPLSLSPTAWLKADAGVYQDAAGTTPATGDIDPVGLWQDQSGNGNHFTQIIDANRPRLKLAANGINGRAALLFDGVNNYLKAAVLTTATSGTFFAVYQLAVTPGSSQAILSSADEISATRFFSIMGFYTAANPYVMIDQRNNDLEDAIRGSSPLAVATQYCLTAQSTGTSYMMRVNQVDQTLAAVAGINTGDWFGDSGAIDNTVIGGIFNSSGHIAKFKGLIAEIILYNTVLAQSDIQRVETYLNSKYG